MHISALPFSPSMRQLTPAYFRTPFFAKYAPANSQAQDIDHLVLTVGIIPSFMPWFGCTQQLRQLDFPPFSKGGFLLVRIYGIMVETLIGLTYLPEGIKATPIGPNLQSSGSPPHL